MAPKASAAFFQFHNNEPICQSVARAEPLLLPPTPPVFREVLPLQRKRAGETCTASGGHSMEKPSGQDRDAGILRRTQSIQWSRASQQVSQIQTQSPVSSPAGGCGETQAPESLEQCHFYHSCPFPSRELSGDSRPPGRLPNATFPPPSSLSSVQAWPDPGS